MSIIVYSCCSREHESSWVVKLKWRAKHGVNNRLTIIRMTIFEYVCNYPGERKFRMYAPRWCRGGVKKEERPERKMENCRTSRRIINGAYRRKQWKSNGKSNWHDRMAGRCPALKKKTYDNLFFFKDCTLEEWVYEYRQNQIRIDNGTRTT